MSIMDPSFIDSESITDDYRVAVAYFLVFEISFFSFKLEGKLNPTLGTLLASNCYRLSIESLLYSRYNPTASFKSWQWILTFLKSILSC